MLFDEPTSALDPELVGEVLSVIGDLAREKRTMILVTHEMKFARDLRQLAAELGQVVLGDAAGPGDVDDASFDGVCVGHGRFVVRQPV